MYRIVALSLLAVTALVVPALAQDKAAPQDPKSAPAEKPTHHLSSPIVKDIKELEHFIYGEAEITFDTMMDAMTKTFFPLMESLGKNGVVYDYPAIFVYKGATEDPKKKFTFQTGYPARPDCKAPEGFKIRKLEAHRCVSIYFTGPLTELEAAYKAVYAQIAKAGHQPTGESRELYLFWDGEASPNTVVEIQVGIARPAKDDKDAKKEE
ncbi:MAG: GyrI-like domain-containing protein [Phycisphaeraceae bacterium]